MKQLTVLLSSILLYLVSTSAFAAEFEKPDVAPVPVRTPPPTYPPAMKMKGISGMVVVNVVIDSAGEVENVAVRKSTHPEFEDPAVKAVRRWRFKPAKKDGDAIRARVAVPLKFAIK